MHHPNSTITVVVMYSVKHIHNTDKQKLKQKYTQRTTTSKLWLIVKLYCTNFPVKNNDLLWTKYIKNTHTHSYLGSLESGQN